MKTEVLAKEVSFYSKDFKDDITTILSIEQITFNKIIEWLKQIKKLSQVVSTEEFVDLSRIINMPIEDIQRVFRPTTLIAYSAANYRTNPDDLIDDMVEDKILSEEALIKRVKLICSYIFPIVSDKIKKTAPKVPLRYINEITSRCIIISDLGDSFNVEKDKTNTYIPKLESLHPAITLKLTFKDKSDKPIGMVLSLDDIKRLKKWLDLSEIELNHVSKQLPTNLVIIDEPVE
jgi:hypothetical protein